MALSDLRATITYPQKMKLRELIERKASFSAQWFAALKADLDQLEDLSSHTASAYIAALVAETSDPPQTEPSPPEAPEPAQSRPMNDDPGTITPRQRGYLKQLLKQVTEHPAGWYKDLQDEPNLIDSLSMLDASRYIGSLRQALEKVGETTSSEATRPSSAQFEVAMTMLHEFGLMQDGLIDIDVLLKAFDRRGVSTFIKALKRIPKLKEALAPSADPA